MYKILKKEILAPKIKLMEVDAPEICRHACPGQFIVLRMHEKGERIPLTIADSDRKTGLRPWYFRVGKAQKVGSIVRGDFIQDIVGPLGTPRDIEKLDCVVM